MTALEMDVATKEDYASLPAPCPGCSGWIYLGDMIGLVGDEWVCMRCVHTVGTS